VDAERWGEPKKLVAEFRALKAAELAYARELGLTPAARKTLASNGKGFDLAADVCGFECQGS
jgi:phage terminase small subunit